MSIERSHGKPRVTRARVRDAAAVAPDADRRRANHDERGRFAAGNAAGAGRAAKTILERPEGDIEAALAHGSGGQPDASARVQLIRDVRSMYRGMRKDLASDAPAVLASAATFARETVLAGYLLSQAVIAGVDTDRGMKLLDAAQKCEARAERASLHAFALAKQIATSKRKPTDPHKALIDAFGEPGGAT